MPSVVVDAHAHLIVPEITREAAPGEAWRPRVFWEDGKQVVEYGGKQIRSAVREFVDVELILEAQRSAGIDQTVLCPWVSLLRYEEEPEEGLRLSRVYNEALVRTARSHAPHVRVLGTVPLQDPPRAVRELEAWMGEDGFVGVEIAASVRGSYLGDPRFRPFWEAAEATGALIFVHPTTRGFLLGVMDQYYLWNTIGNPLETTITAAHMALAGVLESYPRLKVLLAHGGGALLALRGRLSHGHAVQPQARADLRESPLHSLRRFYFDTVVHDASVLRHLVDFAGADRVLLGSDYPFDMGSERPAEIVRSLGLPAAQEEQILGGNAGRLMKKEG